MLDKELDGSGRRTDEEAQLGNGALALRFIRDGKSFNGMEDKQQVHRYRRRIRVNGKADDTRGRVLCDCGIRMAVSRFQPGHEQGKHNAHHRDQAHQLPGLELAGSGLHGHCGAVNRALSGFSLQQFPQLCQRLLWCIDAECSVLGTHESV
jgi:hypothetical protein